MADKRISQLVDRGTVANNDVVPIVVSGATTTNKATISSIQTFMQGNLDLGVTSVGITLGSSGTDVSVSGSPITSSGNITINFPTASAANRGLLSSADWTTFNNKVSSVGLSMPSAFSVANSPITGSGTIAVTGAGTVAQYIRGDGSLADFPSGGGGGGSSVSYYLNGSVSQGTIGGIAYKEMNKTPVLGAGTDFVAIADGYLASFITDAGDPNLLEIPAGNWNFETYFSASSGGGSPSFYIELYKVNSGGTATLIASNSATPELISFGTSISPYFSPLAVPTTVLTVTDRLAVRYYVARSGRTITLHTENSHLCQIITTFTTGLTALNGLTAQVQNFATGTSGTDFGISSSVSTHTFNLPDASATARGVVTTGSQTFAGAKTFNSSVTANSLIKTGGTSSQFLKADGSVDSSTYLTTGSAGSTYVPYSGAAASVNLGVYTLTANAINSTGSGSTSGQINLRSDAFFSLVNGYGTLGSGTSNTFVFYQTTALGAFRGAILSLNSITESATRTYTLPDATGTIALVGGAGVGTVTSVAALTLGTSGTDLSSTVANGTTTPVITLNVPTASATNRGALSSSDWTTFNNKQNALTNPVTGTGATGQVAYWSGTNSQVGSNNLFWDNANVKLGIGTNTPESTGLTIAGGGILVSLDSGAARKVLELYANSTGAKVSSTYVGASSYGSLELLTSNEARLTIESTGAATFSNNVSIYRNVAATATTLTIENATNNYNCQINFKSIYGGSTAKSFLVGSNINSGGGSWEVYDATESATRMVISSTGNVGIGPASPYGKLEITGLANNYNTAPAITLTDLAGDANSNRWIVGNIATDYGSFNIASAPTPTSTTWTPRITINRSGNVGIGTASPNFSSYGAGITVLSLATSTADKFSVLELAGNRGTGENQNGNIDFVNNNGTATVTSRITALNGASSVLDGILTFHTRTSAGALTERMRITSGGYLKASTTGVYDTSDGGTYHEIRVTEADKSVLRVENAASSSPYGLEVLFPNADPNNATNYVFKAAFTNLANNIYTIFSNGTVSSRSDARWKKNIETTRNGYIDDLCKLRVVKYNWYNHEDDAPKELGLIAQEVEEVFPNLIHSNIVISKREVEQEDGTIIEEEFEDGVSRSIKTSVLPFMLLKAMQEQQAQIQELKTEIDSLKNQMK